MKTGRLSRFQPCVFAALTLFATTVMPAANAQTEGGAEREEAEAEAAYEQFLALQEEVDAAIASYEAIRAETFDLEYHLERLKQRVQDDAELAGELRKQVEELAIADYKAGSRRNVNAALEAETIQDMVTSQALFERANEVSIASLDRLEAVTREMQRLTAGLAVDRARLLELETEAVAAVEQIQVVQAAALEWYEREDAEAKAARAAWKEELERRRRAEAARRAREAARKAAAEARAAVEAQRRAEEEAARRVEVEREAAAQRQEESEIEEEDFPDGPNQSGIYDYLSCPQANPRWFRDTWGAPRSGGRKHKGTDIYSPKSTKVYAVVSGWLRTRAGGLGGRALWLYGNDGNAYYYGHLDGWASGISTGTRVFEGDVIAFVGNTGNASGGAYHTHFQLHPDGGSPINPYPTLASIC